VLPTGSAQGGDPQRREAATSSPVCSTSPEGLAAWGLKAPGQFRLEQPLAIGVQIVDPNPDGPLHSAAGAETTGAWPQRFSPLAVAEAVPLRGVSES